MTVETGAPAAPVLPQGSATQQGGAAATPAELAARAAALPAGGDANTSPLAAAAAVVATDSLTIGDEAAVVAPTPEAGAGAATEVVYNPTGNIGLDMALSFIGKLGIKADSPAMLAAEAGDFTILKAQLATMGDKARGWEANVALGEKGFSDLKAGIDLKKSQDTQAIHAAVGGAENWAEVKKFAAAATADAPAERGVLNKMLSAGGLEAKVAATYLYGLFQQTQATAPNKEPEAVVGARGGAPTQQPGPTNGALSPRQYTAEVAKLAAKMGGRMDGSPEYKGLQDRRAMWREAR